MAPDKITDKTTDETGKSSPVDIKIFGEEFRVRLTGPESASDILEVARQVDSEMLSETQKNPSTRIRAALWTAFLIANRYRELKIDLAHNQEKASRRLRRERHYTRCSHERELLALLEDPTLSAKERHEVLRDLGKLRGYYRAPVKRKHKREIREV